MMTTFESSLQGNAEGYGREDGRFNKYTQEQQAVSVACTHLSSPLTNVPPSFCQMPSGFTGLSPFKELS